MKHTLLFFCLLAGMQVSGQTISGRLTDEAHQSMEFANVVLLTQKDSAFVTGTVSDEQGDFSLITPSATVAYLLKLSSIGYQTTFLPVKSGDLGVIILKSDAHQLGEVVVKGDLPKTQIKRDAMVTNVAGTVLAQAGTGKDLLEKIPGVIKSNGGLTVFGRGTPVIYINGRLMRDASELDQLSSDNVKSVEVVTNPGARYDASVKAVIRIQTKKAVGDGFGFNNRAYARYNKEWIYLDQFNYNYRKGGFDLFGMLYYDKERTWREFDVDQHTYLDATWKQASHSRQNSASETMIGSLGMNYIFNTNHSIGASYRIQHLPWSNYYSNFVTNLYRDNTLYEQLDSDNNSDQTGDTHRTSFYYNGKMGEWSIDFNADALWKDTSDDEHVAEAAIDEKGESSRRQVNTYSSVKNNLYAGKLIISRPLWGGDFSVGGEYSYTDRSSSFTNTEGILRDDINKIKEGSTSLFVEYGREFGKLGTQIGLRYESVAFDYYQAGVYMDEQSRNYNNLFPTVSFSLPIGKVQTQLSYRADISRPSYHTLRSSISYVNRYTYESGNPFLIPTISHNIALNATYKWWMLSAGYMRVIDDRVYFSEAYSADDPTIALLSIKNIDPYDKMYATLNASPKIGIWSPQFSVGMEKQWLKAETPEGERWFNDPIGYLGWKNALKLPAGFLVNVDASWRGTGYAGHDKAESVSWGVDASVYKAFFKESLSFLLKGTDLFLTEESNFTSYSGKLRTIRMYDIPNTRGVSLTVRYKFNSARSKYKGTGAGDSQKNRM